MTHLNSQLLVVFSLGFLGLIIGSFLNVVVYRLPLMIKADLLSDTNCETTLFGNHPTKPVLNLAEPRSKCESCDHSILWYENIPVLSFLWLQGKCPSCKTKISIRHPIVECCCALIFSFLGWRFGFSVETLTWCFFCASILCAGLIDWDTTLLPNVITIPLLSSGLVLSALGLTTIKLTSSAWGALAGYIALWSTCYIFKLITNKQGMGHGDFKFLAAIGAWFGWKLLLPLLLIASILGSIFGIYMKTQNQLRQGLYLPFGPFLAFSSISILGIGFEKFNSWIGF